MFMLWLSIAIATKILQQIAPITRQQLGQETHNSVVGHGAGGFGFAKIATLMHLVCLLLDDTFCGI